ncbi:MAG: hypothetical protein K2K57_01835 [Oscillospiraceae bacterium]|nr:hypothetical protein [Oscillospiraceae bacterium]
MRPDLYSFASVFRGKAVLRKYQRKGLTNMKISKILAAALGVMVLVGGTTVFADGDNNNHAVPKNNYEYYYQKYGIELSGLYYGYVHLSDVGHILDLGDNNFEGMEERQTSMHCFDNEGNFCGYYSGFTENSVGKRYYKFGKRVFGWYKTEGGWRHFDEDGYMSVGKTMICGSNYYFDENGLWTCRLDKSGLAPEDFAVRFEYDNAIDIPGIDSGFDSGIQNAAPQKFFSESLLPMIFDDDGNTIYGDTSREITISKADRQVLYCMFLESGFGEADLSRALDYDYLHEYMDKHNGDENGYIKKFKDVEHNEYDSNSDGDAGSKITVTVNGKTYSVCYSEDLMGQLAGYDNTATAVIFLSDSLDYYDSFLEQKFPQTFGSKVR